MFNTWLKSLWQILRAKNNYVTTLIVNRYALRVINFPRQNLLSCWRPAGGPRPQFHCTNRRKLFLLSKRKHKMASHKKYHQLKIRLQWAPYFVISEPKKSYKIRGPFFILMHSIFPLFSNFRNGKSYNIRRTLTK